MEEKNLNYENNENENTFISRIIRNILRNLSYLTKIETIGRLPLKLPSKIIGKSANQITQINEIIEKLKNSYEEIKNKNIKSIYNSIFHITIMTYHNIIKSGLLGGLVFQLYEDILTQTNQNKCSKISNKSINFNNLVLYSSLYSLSAGLLSGSVHGLLYTLWDKSLYILLKYIKLPSNIYNEIIYHIPPNNSIHILGTTLSHSLVHGSLFGTYEFFKRLCLYLIGLTHESHHLTLIEGGISIFCGGLMCGIVSDTVGTITNSFEENGIKYTIENFNLKNLQFRYSVRSIGPTILGFYAYEYTKDSFLSSLES